MEDNDDPVVLLHQIQKGYDGKGAQGEEQVLHASPLECSKNESEINPNSSATNIATHERLSKVSKNDLKKTPEYRVHPFPPDRSPLDGGPHRNNEEGLGGKKVATLSLFLEKLSQMDAKSHLPSLPTYDATAEARHEKIKQKIREERKRMLVFRDVGMDLDKPILSRDVFLMFKYFYYGTEFAIDNELERMLRYFNEDALSELKIIDNSKLMRGPSTLSRRQKSWPPHPHSAFSSPSIYAGGENAAWAPDAKPAMSPLDNRARFDSAPRISHAKTGGAESLPLPPTFPNVSCANMRQFCADFNAEVCQVLRDALRPSPLQSLFGGFFTTTKAATPVARGVQKNFSSKDASLFTPLSAGSFRRPALVIYSQLGHKFGSTADAMWRRLAYHTICPALMAYMPEVEEQRTGADAAAKGPLESKHHLKTTTHRNMPIDVVSLRSMDLYKYRWVHNLYVQRFAQSLSMNTQTSNNAQGNKKEDHFEAAMVNNALLASTTFLGTKMLEPFFTSFNLRNYMCPYAMLVDHEGVVRWISGGCPDAYEAAHFPGLLRQLESEYFKSNIAH
ncbi:unnamed protein product [Phytomonas sp. EM1]|nr:unnamed protein product [Phytomonas sp. EM1]|eukprot:CCW63926.1 unnamed protein product [Phytomonas sp. isolate EM1]